MIELKEAAYGKAFSNGMRNRRSDKEKWTETKEEKKKKRYGSKYRRQP